MSASALAANARLYQAIQSHQRGDFVGAREELLRVVKNPLLSDDDRTTADEYLASAELSLERRDEAKTTLRALLHRHPDVHLDPELFFPELIALAEQVRIELSAEAAAAAPLVAPPEAVRVSAPGDSPSRSWGRLSLIGGTGLAVASGVLQAVAYGADWVPLHGATAPGNPGELESQGRGLQTAAEVTGSVALAALVAGAILYVLGAPSASAPMQP